MVVSWTTALPCGTGYRVATTITSVGGAGGADYLSAGSKAATSVTITLHSLINGSTGTAPAGFAFDWIAICDNNP